MASHFSSCRPWWLTLLAIVLLSGCGGPRVARVTGRVTYAGNPVTAGKILFYPASGRMALGATRTRAPTRSGCCIARHSASFAPKELPSRSHRSIPSA